MTVWIDEFELFKRELALFYLHFSLLQDSMIVLVALVIHFKSSVQVFRLFRQHTSRECHSCHGARYEGAAAMSLL